MASALPTRSEALPGGWSGARRDSRTGQRPRQAGCGAAPPTRPSHARDMDSGPEHDPANGDGRPPATANPLGRGPPRERRSHGAAALLPEPRRARRAGDAQPPAAAQAALRLRRSSGSALLAFVSWIFGIMMAVAQDLPALESREQYKRAENSVVYDAYGKKLATLTNNQGRVLVSSDGDRSGDEGGRGRDRGPALLRAQRGRLPGHRPRRLAGRHLRLGSAGRLDDHPAVRQERARRAGQPDRVPEAARGGARLPPRAPVVEGQDPHRVPERDLLRRGRDRDRGGREDLLRATTTPAAARATRPSRAPRSCCPGRRRCSPG